MRTAHGAKALVTRRAPAADGHAEPNTLATIELLFSHVDQNMAGAEFPDENFVFSDNFRTILRTAGLESYADDV